MSAFASSSAVFTAGSAPSFFAGKRLACTAAPAPAPVFEVRASAWDEIPAESRGEYLAAFRQGENDVGSAAVQIATLTARIKMITEHLKDFKKDFAARKGLEKLVGQRRRLMRYLKSDKPAVYYQTIKQLGLKAL
eukprot:tig00001206_g7508.t1